MGRSSLKAEEGDGHGIASHGRGHSPSWEASQELGASGRKCLTLRAQQSLSIRMGYTCSNELVVVISGDLHVYPSCPEKVRHKSLVFSDKTVISLGVGDHNGKEVVLRAPTRGWR